MDGVEFSTQCCSFGSKIALCLLQTSLAAAREFALFGYHRKFVTDAVEFGRHGRKFDLGRMAQPQFEFVSLLLGACGVLVAAMQSPAQLLCLRLQLFHLAGEIE